MQDDDEVGQPTSAYNILQFYSMIGLHPVKQTDCYKVIRLLQIIITSFLALAWRVLENI